MQRDHYEDFYRSKPFQDVFKLSRQSLLIKANPPAYTVLAVSDHCLDLTKYSRERVLNRPLFEAYPDQTGGLDQQLVEESFQRVIDTGQKDVLPVFKYEIFSEADNCYQTLYWSNINEPVFDNSGKVAYLINTTENVTDQMVIEQALRKNMELERQVAGQITVLEDREQLFQSLIEQAPVAIAMMKGPEFVVEVCNEKVLELWGRTSDQVLGLPVFTALPETRGQGFEELLNNVLKTGVRAVINEMPANLLRNGQMETVWVNFIYEPIRNHHGEISSVVVACTEVTEQVNSRMELQKLLAEKTGLLAKVEQLSKQKLAESEQTLAMAVESANLGTWYIDLEDNTFLGSDRTKELFGFEPDDVMSIDDAIALITEDRRDQVVQAFRQSIKHDVPFDMEYKVIGKREKVTRWLRCTGCKYMADEETHTYFAGTLHDITERKELQRRKDEFISIASHELKTPITSLKASLQFMSRLKDESGSETLSKMIDLASGSMNRISTLIDDLLNAAHMQDQELALNKTKFSFSTLVEGCSKHFKLLEKCKLVIGGDPNLQLIADQHRIEQVLVNFLNNAVKYAGDSKEIVLSAERSSRNEIRISVKDNGPGISNEKIRHLFERYYRTDHNETVYAGLGLGLFISADIVKRHGGKIGVESELGKGSTFWFSLPGM
ncbi:MAG TPA: PAS domain-containing sensor histidine kinase [Pedobacter sp.]|nr:PAS domain-containing sensor histidine kinase [Pedobacter sp.]